MRGQLSEGAEEGASASAREGLLVTERRGRGGLGGPPFQAVLSHVHFLGINGTGQKAPR